MNFPDDERIEGLEPIGLGVGTGDYMSGRTIHRGELFYIFKKRISLGDTTILVWSESWEREYLTCWWIYESCLIPIDDPNNMEPRCGICKSMCKKDEPCVFFIGVWEVSKITPPPS